MNTNKILIVGAGIAGLCMYHALRQKGMEAEIIERQPDWYTGGTGIGLPANSVSGLERLGFKDALLGKSHLIDRIEYALADGTTLSIAPLTEPPLNQQPFLALSRKDLIDILRQGVETVQFNSCIRDLVLQEDGVDVTFASGASARYDLVIAADGINSTTRSAVFKDAYVEQMGVTNWRFVIEQDTTGMHPVYYLGKDDAFMLYPMGKDRVYCYGHIEDKDADYLSHPAREILRERFGHYTAPVQAAIGQLRDDGDVMAGRIASVVTQEVAVGRVILIGDALHACSPTLQQGAGQAVEDALQLAELLATQDIDTAFTDFKARRMPQIRWVIQESNRIMRMGLRGKYWLGRLSRNIVIRLFGPVNVLGWRRLMAKR